MAQSFLTEPYIFADNLTQYAGINSRGISFDEKPRFLTESVKVEPSPTKNSASICFGIFDEKICLPSQG